MDGVTHHYKGSRTRCIRCPDEFDEAVRILMKERNQDFGSLCRQALMQCWPQYFDEKMQRQEVEESEHDNRI